MRWHLKMYNAINELNMADFILFLDFAFSFVFYVPLENIFVSEIFPKYMIYHIYSDFTWLWDSFAVYCKQHDYISNWLKLI